LLPQLGYSNERMKPLHDNIILITGASRGIGAAVAKRLAAEGAHVVLAARNVGKLEAVDDAIQALGGKATLVPIDLSKHEDIDALGAGLLEKFGHLDGLIGNAAILGQITPVTHITPKQWQAVLDVNVTANWRLLRICEALLKRAPHPRVAFVTSGITRGSSPYWGGYAMSKAALESFVMTYAAEVRDSPMRVNLIDPSVVATDMRAQAFPSEKRSTLLQPDDTRLTEIFVQAMAKDCTAHGQRFSVPPLVE
jgi:NAD(P)-dependent dehydrogenase (short-subunit alcohol dehydrogenase family)